MSDREARRDLLAEMGAEAMPGGRLTMALFGPHAPMAALAALTAGANAEAADIARLSTAARARNPQAESPAADEQQLTQAATTLAGFLDKGGQAAAAAAGAAGNAAALDQGDPAVATETASAHTAAAQAQQALTQIQTAAAQVDKLLVTADAQVQAWTSVHSAPAGTLSIQETDPPSDWTVRGCEVVTADAGGPARAAGLVGRTQRTDPVGDVITAITDLTDADTTWPVADCGALDAAMAQTRIGDQLTITYEHRHVVWYLLSGVWETRTTTVQLRGTDCPAAVTGRITTFGNRIRMRINVSGPAGTVQDVSAILDTGGVRPTFPNSLLTQLGYRPLLGPFGEIGVVPNASVPAYLYDIPASAFTILDGGREVPIATGTLSVTGIVGGSGTVDNLLGPDILKQGAALNTSGANWAFTPPCATG